MDELLGAACKKLGVNIAQIAGSAVDKDELVVLVNYGIGGIKKYRIPLVEIMPPPPNLAPDPAPAEKPKPNKGDKPDKGNKKKGKTQDADPAETGEPEPPAPEPDPEEPKASEGETEE
jgi:hypothetical protein